ncbi:Translation initiation factor SUI1 family protein [Prunus dulcis]|uniref:Translation initiation factor SUI1 family protein n=1 Tax=Prunus dulcis TaxID=3755 RepID=A0A4Y1RD14_PRUDU|nr:Translation initiation factor SUI1 family protein [Prunus dulcis]
MLSGLYIIYNKRLLFPSIFPSISSLKLSSYSNYLTSKHGKWLPCMGGVGGGWGVEVKPSSPLEFCFPHQGKV